MIKWIKSCRITAYNFHGKWRIHISEVGKLLKGVQRSLLEKLLKTLTRTVAVECYTNEFARRALRVNGMVLERSFVGAINSNLRYLNSNGSPVVLGSAGTYDVLMDLAISHQGVTLLMELQVFANIINC